MHIHWIEHFNAFLDIVVLADHIVVGIAGTRSIFPTGSFRKLQELTGQGQSLPLHFLFSFSYNACEESGDISVRRDCGVAYSS